MASIVDSECSVLLCAHIEGRQVFTRMRHQPRMQPRDLPDIASLRMDMPNRDQPDIDALAVLHACDIARFRDAASTPGAERL